MREGLRRHRFALALIVLLVAVLFTPSIVKREVFTIRDHTDYFQPLRYFTAIHIRDFTLPYWNPYSASGEPWLANPQTAVFYPPTWVFVFLPFETAYMLFLALHLVIAGWGAYLLFARSVSEGAALAGAVAVTFSGPVLSLLDVSNNLATFAWIPWVLWAALSRTPPAMAGLLIAMSFLGGEPFFAAVGALLYAAVLIGRGVVNAGGGGVAGSAPGSGSRHRGNAITLLKTALVAIGLSAIQLVPFLELVRGSDRAARLSKEEIFRESMELGDWIRVAVPPRLNASGYDASLSQHFIPIIYVGAIVALLAVLAWVFVRRREVIGWSLLLAAAIVVAAGNHLPVGKVFELIPVTPFRYPSRAVPFGALAIAALASLGWNRFRPQKRWADLLLVVILVVDLLPRAAPLLRTSPFRTDLLPYPEAVGRAGKFVRVHDGALIDRRAWMAGYVNLYQRRFDTWTAAPLVSERYSRVHEVAVLAGRLDLLQFLGTGFVLSETPLGPPLRRLTSVRGVTAYTTPREPRFAMLWTGWKPAGSAAEALDATIQSGMSSGVAVAGAAPPPAPRRVQLLSPESLVLDTRTARAVVNAPDDSVLVLTQQDSPSWRVYVDGVAQKKLLAGGIFRAVHVPRGRHEVIWKWDPSSLRIGATMTSITVLFLSMIFFVKRFTRRKFSS